MSRSTLSKRNATRQPGGQDKRTRSHASNSNTVTPNKALNPNKSNQSQNMDIDDDVSTSTDTATNKSKKTLATNHATFLTFAFEVPKSAKGSETMRLQISKLFKILRDADDSLAFSHYKLDSTLATDTNLHLTSTSLVIQDPDDLLTSITAMSKYFFGARPNSKGGTIWTNVRILHDGDIDNIIADTREDLQEHKARLLLQTIQHWDVVTLGFFKHLHPDIDVENFTAYLAAQLKSWHKGPTLLFGLKVKTPYDGKKGIQTRISPFVIVFRLSI